MKRKIISTFLALIGLLIIGYAVLYYLGLYDDQNSGVLITSDPKSEVFINGNLVGETPYESTDLVAGDAIIKIKPISSGDIGFDDYETKIKFVSGVKTIIKRSFRDSDEESSGVTVSFEKIGSSDSLVNIISVPDKAKIFIDSNFVGYTPLRLSIPAGDHDLLVQFDDYDDVSLPIKVYKGFKLTSSVKLAKSVEKVTINDQPIENEQKKQIRINKNELGFLRVRSGASTGFPEVGQVKPDEVYDILEEGEKGKWFKIELIEVEGQPANRQGWVSGEFVTRL